MSKIERTGLFTAMPLTDSAGNRDSIRRDTNLKLVAVNVLLLTLGGGLFLFQIHTSQSHSLSAREHQWRASHNAISPFFRFLPITHTHTFTPPTEIYTYFFFYRKWVTWTNHTIAYSSLLGRQ